VGLKCSSSLLFQAHTMQQPTQIITAPPSTTAHSPSRLLHSEVVGEALAPRNGALRNPRGAVIPGACLEAEAMPVDGNGGLVDDIGPRLLGQCVGWVCWVGVLGVRGGMSGW